MNDSILDIGADGIDVEKIIAAVKTAVAEKAARGVYRDARIARAEKANLASLTDDESLVRFYLDCLRNAAVVDVNDFDISERRRLFGALAIAFKKIVWKLLKFYTYRLWSQQNQVNSLLVAAIENLDEKYRKRIKDLDLRLAAHESGKNEPCRPPHA